MKVVYSDVSIQSCLLNLWIPQNVNTAFFFQNIFYILNLLYTLFYLQNKYKSQYEKMKHRYTAIADTPLLIRAKKSYFQSSDVSQQLITQL